MTNESATPSTFRPDIEGLRALAVLLVVVYHAHFGPFHGGLIGVDVFFVLSGFLITSLLLRERQNTGTIRLADFWARRIRRLLPASSLVVIATLIAARWMVPPILIESIGRDALAAVGFVINIVFGHRASDYLGGQLAESAPSPLLHFWSLAVEEQFYLVWPLILWSLARLKARLSVTVTLVGLLATASLVYCLWMTSNSPVWAFYLLPTRAWELLAGAALAVVGTRVARVPATIRAGAGWLGLSGIVLASLVISDRTSFPGYAALLPVLSTAAVIASGVAASRWSPARLLSLPPLQWIGARSYAIYLWHWPALILAEARWGDLGPGQRVAAVGVSLVLAVASHALVENPIRHARWLAVRPLRSYSMGLGMVAAGLLVAAVTINTERDIAGGDEASTPTLAPPSIPPPSTSTAPTGAPSDTVVPSEPTSTTVAPEPSFDEMIGRFRPILVEAVSQKVVPSNLTPGLSERPARTEVWTNDCLLFAAQVKVPDCVYGDPQSKVSIAILGDSHAAQWHPALRSIAEKRRWRYTFYGKTRCPAGEYNSAYTGARTPKCNTWRESVIKLLESNPVDVVILTSKRYPILDGMNQSRTKRWQEGQVAVARRLAATGARVIILGDPPLPRKWPATCLSRHLKSATECLVDRAAGEPPGLVEADRSAASETGATYISTADWFCDGTRCAVMMGNINLYHDNNHISIPAAMFFAPLLEAAIVEHLPPEPTESGQA